jgi:hypothetical protein
LNLQNDAKDNNRILYLARHDGDLERICALAHFFVQDFEQVVLKVESDNSFNNRISQAVLKDLKIDFKSHFCLSIFGRFRSRIEQKFGNRIIFKPIKMLLRIAHGFYLRRAVMNYVADLKPSFIFRDTVGCDHQIAPLMAFDDLFSRGSNPFFVICICHGSTDFFPQEKLDSAPKFAFADIFTGPNLDDIAAAVTPHIPSDRAAIITGDPRYSKNYIEYLKKLARPALESESKSIIVLGPNLSGIGYTHDDTDRLLYEVALNLRKLTSEKIIVKPHPRSQPTPTRFLIQKIDNLEMADAEIGTFELLLNASYCVTPPTSAIFEAVLLGVPVVIIKPKRIIDGYKETFLKLDCPILFPDEIKSLKFNFLLNSALFKQQVAAIVDGSVNIPDSRKQFGKILDSLKDTNAL